MPSPEQLAYRGLTSGSAQCMAYRGFICGVIVRSWHDTMKFTVQIVRKLGNRVAF